MDRFKNICFGIISTSFCIFYLILISTAWARDDSLSLYKVGVIDASDYFDRSEWAGLVSKGGLAFPPYTQTLLRLDRVTEGATGIITTTSATHPGDPVSLMFEISNPLNLTSDGMTSDERSPGSVGLLLFESATNELMAVKAGPQGKLDPVSMFHIDGRRHDVNKPVGLAYDAAGGSVFILDGDGPTLLRIGLGFRQDIGDSTDSIQTFETSLHSAPDDLRGLALNPANQQLYTVSPSTRTLYEMTQSGQLVNAYILPGVDRVDPRAMVFAPSGDHSDDPAVSNLFIATGNGATGAVTEWTFVPQSQQTPHGATTRGVAQDVVGALIRTVDVSQFIPPSPDTTGIAYLADRGTFLLSDSEVNEIPELFSGDNLFEMDLSGMLVDTSSTIDFSSEPTGVAFNPSNGHIFISDDDADKVFELDAENNLVGSLNTRTFNPKSRDPEDVAYDSKQGVLFIIDGDNAEVYRIDPGENGVFDGLPPAGDDEETHFDTGIIGVTDPEGITYDADNHHLYIVGHPRDSVFQITTSGVLVRRVDISAANSRAPAGLAYAPGSDNFNNMNIYITDRGVDNDSQVGENDGRVYEFSLPPLTPGNNEAPRVDAGADRTITLANDLMLNGSISDDRLPDPPGMMTINWSRVGGPGTVTFTDPTANSTNASFSATGSYVLRLTVSDGMLSTSDEITITVLENTILIDGFE